MDYTEDTINDLVQRLSLVLMSLISESVPVPGQMDAMNEAKELSETLAALVHNRLQAPEIANALNAASNDRSWESLADATIEAAGQLGL